MSDDLQRDLSIFLIGVIIGFIVVAFVLFGIFMYKACHKKDVMITCVSRTTQYEYLPGSNYCKSQDDVFQNHHMPTYAEVVAGHAPNTEK